MNRRVLCLVLCAAWVPVAAGCGDDGSGPGPSGPGTAPGTTEDGGFEDAPEVVNNQPTSPAAPNDPAGP